MLIPNLFSECKELQAIRNSTLYSVFRPELNGRFRKYDFVKDNKIDEEAEAAIDAGDRLLASIDIILGDIFENIRTRQFLKVMMIEERDCKLISPLAVNSFHRWYAHELIVLFDRLERIIGLLEIGYGKRERTKEMEVGLLSFFPPVLFEKRIHNQHMIYLGAPHSKSPNSFFVDGNDYESKKQSYIDVANLAINEFNESERNLCRFLPQFCNKACAFVISNGEIRIPPQVTDTFRISQRISRKNRLRNRHREIFNQQKT